ncbi:MAG: glycosyltransferase [Tepidisphaerales bacterium]
MPDSRMLAVIPAYRRPDQLARCLAALDASTTPVSRFVHDNSQHNVGFTRACNLGLRAALRDGFPYALLLNQDCYVQPDALSKLLAFLDAHPRCGIAGVKQLKADEPDVIIHGGCLEAFPAGRHVTGRVSAGQCNQSLPMPWVNGACMAVRTEMLLDTGLMDEGYFLIASDSDFCFTARQRGWEVWYCADAVVLHETGGVSRQQTDLDAAAYFNADQARFRDKWVGTMGYELLRQMPPPPGFVPAAGDLQRALQQAQHHYQKHELGQAELQARHILSHVPDQPDALLLLGRTHLRIGLPALAVRELRTALSRAPDSATLHFALADALMVCQAVDEALQHYRRAAELGLSSAELHNNFGVALLRAGQRDAAAEQWRKALTLEPSNATARKNLQDSGFPA